MRCKAAILAGILIGAITVESAITVGTSTTGWKNLPIKAGTNNGKGGNKELAVIGNSDHPAGYVRFDGPKAHANSNAQISYRLRLSGQKGKSPMNGHAWIGLDADLDGTLDVFIGASSHSIGIYKALPPKTGGSSFTIEEVPLFSLPSTKANFNWSPVTQELNPSGKELDLDKANGNDFFVTYSIPFDALSKFTREITGLVEFTETTSVNYIAGTSASKNARNPGQSKKLTDSNSFISYSLGEGTLTVSGTPVPEPETYALLSGLATGFILLLHKRKRALKLAP